MSTLARSTAAPRIAGGVVLSSGALVLAATAVVLALVFAGGAPQVAPRVALDAPVAIGLLAMGLGVVALLVGLAFLVEGVALLRMAAPRETPPPPRLRSGPSLADLEGVGPETAAQLGAAGVSDVRALASCDPETVAARAGLAPSAVRFWRKAARHALLPHVGPREAWLLVAAGVDDPDDLARADPVELARRLNDANRTERRLAGEIAPGEVRLWIEGARRASG